MRRTHYRPAIDFDDQLVEALHLLDAMDVTAMAGLSGIGHTPTGALSGVLDLSVSLRRHLTAARVEVAA